MHKSIRYIIYIASAVFLLANSEFRTLVRNSLELSSLKKQSGSLDDEYAKLHREKERLLDEKDGYLEKLARTELHLVKPGEMEFRFPPPAKNK